MDHIRWLIKRAFGRDPALILPCMLVTVLVVGASYAVHVIIGVVLTIAALSFWGTILYAFLSDAFRTSYVNYQQEKQRGSKTPR